MMIQRKLAIALVLAVLGCSEPAPPVAQTASKAAATSNSVLPFAETLEQAETVEILSILVPRGKAADLTAKHGKMQGYPVLGKTLLTDVAARQNLIAVLLRDTKALGPMDALPRCFDPRHGVRATRKGKTLDLVICFECSQVKVYADGQSLSETYMVGKLPESAFDAVLKTAGIALSRDFE